MPILPDAPRIIPVLSATESTRLTDRYGNLPSMQNCITCRGNLKFRWYTEAGPRDLDHVEDWECNCEAQFILYRYMLSRGIGLNYQRLDWVDATGVPEDVNEVVFDYIEHQDRYVGAGIGLVLRGERGTGKSLLANLLLKRLLSQGVDGMVLTFHEALDAFTDGWHQKEDRVWFEKRIRNADVLVLDDAGREHAGRSQVAETVLDHVLRHRVSNALPTLLTTNLDLRQLATLYSGNAMSLLAESAIVHEFRGVDFRDAHRVRKIDETKAGLTRPVVL